MAIGTPSGIKRLVSLIFRGRASLGTDLEVTNLEDMQEPRLVHSSRCKDTEKTSLGLALRSGPRSAGLGPASPGIGHTDPGAANEGKECLKFRSNTGLGCFDNYFEDIQDPRLVYPQNGLIQHKSQTDVWSAQHPVMDTRPDVASETDA